ncbi:MAG: hypothetical protein ACJ72P_15710 [Nocardioides sp.]|jgi:hypothetical protein
MSINKIQTMGQSPSRFGMPTPEVRLGVYAGSTVCTTGAPIFGDRVAARVWGAFPGTSAWRPPTC